jgi:hypothetical protein
MLTNIILVYSLLAGVFAALLFAFTLFFGKEKKKSRNYLIWAVLFLASSFLATEYAFWLEGYNLFEFAPKSFPLIFYFGIWFAFIVWLFESRKERKVWIIFLILLIIAILVATSCMNCVNF